MDINEIIELNIESLAYGGEGVAKYNGIAVFVDSVAIGDVIKAKIVSLKKNFAKAVLEEIISPSPDRIKPFCPIAKACGGCQWQHIDYEAQLKAKQTIVKDCLQKIAGVETEPEFPLSSGQIKNFRCKIQYPVQQTKVSKRFLAGYYKKNSHELTNIKFCPIQPEIIDNIAKSLREISQELELTAYNEQNKKGLIRHFVFRYSSSDSEILLTIVVNSKKLPEKISELCEKILSEYKEIVGVLVNFNTANSNIILGKETELVCGKDFIFEKIDDKTFKISAESFFQVNPKAAELMFKKVREFSIDKLGENFSVLDIYSGSGSFGIFLADIAKEITAVEASLSSVNDGEETLKLNNINNINFINQNAETALNTLIEDEKTYDLVILDPPRKGCSEEVINSVKNLAQKYIIYVSCNPSTLARDIKLLSDSFAVEKIQPVDMFSHTYHVETIALLQKKS